MSKKSIRFFNDCSMRAVWDDGNNCRWFSATNIVLLAKHYPNNRASKFLDWFTFCDNTIDGQSRKKAYTLFESGLLNSLEPGSMKCLQQTVFTTDGIKSAPWLTVILQESSKFGIIFHKLLLCLQKTLTLIGARR